MPASTIRSFSSADHFRRLLMSFPPGVLISLHPEEKAGYFRLCAIGRETLHDLFNRGFAASSIQIQLCLRDAVDQRLRVALIGRRDRRRQREIAAEIYY